MTKPVILEWKKVSFLCKETVEGRLSDEDFASSHHLHKTEDSIEPAAAAHNLALLRGACVLVILESFSFIIQDTTDPAEQSIFSELHNAYIKYSNLYLYLETHVNCKLVCVVTPCCLFPFRLM